MIQNNKSKLKAYVRYDGTGRVIAGGPILSNFKPKVGNWVEINANLCCNDTPLLLTSVILGTFPVIYPYVNLACSGTETSTNKFTNVNSIADVAELVALLNANTETKALGKYSVINETTVQISIPTSVQNELCAGGELTFHIYED